MPDDQDDAPPAIPHREPREVARRIAAGHARAEHFPELRADALAQIIEDALGRGERRMYDDRTLYWDEQEGVVVIVNPRDPDGGTAFPSYREFFEDWGQRWRSRS